MKTRDNEAIEVETEVFSVRVTRPLANLVREYMKIDSHITVSDFVRDAIRTKIREEAPWLLKRMMKKEIG